MSQYEEFCNRLGKKYLKNYQSICTDDEYNKIKTLDNTIDKNQYIQASAEQVFYYKLKKDYASIKHDQNVNSDNGTDVDLYYDGEPFNLRIEVKTPVLFENTDNYEEDLKNGITIHGEQNQRYPESVVTRLEMNEVLDEITDALGHQAAVKKMDDNKIKDYLISAQTKMIDSDEKTINVLLICLSSNDLTKYFNYIVNPYTGLASKEPYIEKEKYSKVDFIVLSNCVEGHLDKNYLFNVWKGDNYVNFVIPNMNKLSNENFKNKNCYLCKKFNDQFYCYNLERDKYITINGSRLDDRYGMINFLTDKFIQFAPNKDLRKYK